MSGGRQPTTILWSGMVFLIVAVMWLSMVAFLFPFQCRTLSCWGQFGDSFGLLNSLFSGLALTGLVVSLRLQHLELSSQVEEMERSRQADQKRRLSEVALDLHAEWHGQEMREHRLNLTKLLQSIRTANRKMGWRVLLGQDPIANDKEIRSTRAILQFFEKWAVLKVHACVDDVLLGQLLGRYYKDVYHGVLMPLQSDRENVDPGEITAIQLIFDQLGMLHNPETSGGNDGTR